MTCFAGYEPLVAVLHHALVQAAEGKGRDRHANDLTFSDQPIGGITREVGLGFPIGQCRKKCLEAIGMASRGETEAAYHELLGAIVYTAGAAMALRDAQSAAEGASVDFTPRTTGNDERPRHGPENGHFDDAEGSA